MIDVSALSKEEVLNDLRIVLESRHASLIGRKEVFMGKAKFGIFGDGKELAQVAMAKAFKNGGDIQIDILIFYCYFDICIYKTYLF